MLDIVCILFDPNNKGLPDYSARAGYSAEWVDKLARAIRRNTTLDHQIICLVDQDYDFQEPVEKIPLITKETGWGCVMETFRPEIGTDQRFVIGLDTIITGDLNQILSWRGQCGLLTDPYHRETLCNGVGSFHPDFCEWIWKAWQRRNEYGERIFYNGRVSEMAFLRLLAADAVRLDELFPAEIQSYKVEWRKTPAMREQAKIVYFHGNPKPPNIEPELLQHWI